MGGRHRATPMFILRIAFPYPSHPHIGLKPSTALMLLAYILTRTRDNAMRVKSAGYLVSEDHERTHIG